LTASAPPRPPRANDPGDRVELEALVEALIEEARQRARRRRRIYTAAAAFVALVGITVFAIFDRAAQSQNAFPGLAARPSLTAGPAGSKMAFISEPLHMGYAGVVYVMNADGSGKRRLAPAFPGMRWSPDGQKIAFATWQDSTSDVYVMNADGSGQERLTSDADWDGSPAWSPDGQTIAFARHPVGGPSSEVYVMNPDGSGQRRLTSDATDGTPAWSPDGRTIAFVGRGDGDMEIYVMNADGSGHRKLTRNAVRDSDPVWSSDGRRIAFVSNWQVYVMNADGSGKRRLTRNGGQNVAPAWSPDGRKVAFERRLGRVKYGPCNGCGRALSFEVYVMNADGTMPRRLTRRGAQPLWSPNGRRIGFVSERDGNAEIYVMNANGSGQRNLTRTRDRHERWFTWSSGQVR
jgi:dipeptidyl aminopeptidase/acylaminoacyl peptidase